MMLRSALRTGSSLAAITFLASTLSACVVGPKYVRPTAPVASSFKEAAGWTPSRPADALDRGAWWSLFGIAELDQLERRVEVSNQNVAAAEAAYRQARALVAESRAALFPTVGVSGSADRSHSRGVSATSYNASVGASWAPDLWGRVRNTIASNQAFAQSAAADLASAKLSMQTELAVDYFTVRALDEQVTLLNEAASNYQRVVQVTQNQYNAGVAARADLITAQTQLQNAQASLVDVGVQRAQAEHAIAILVGVAPSELTLAPATLPRDIPTVPAGVPSTLLERRPDIAASERQVAAANAQIGIQTAAFFPSVTLSGSYGFAANSLGALFNASSSIWSFGPQIAETVLDFGARRAAVQAARASYDAAVARYRQTVLDAFESVEDQIAALRILEQEAVLRASAEASARQAEALALNRYRAGQVDFTTVVLAQNTALQAEQTSLSVLRSRLSASVSLIENLGGGWNATELAQR